MATKAREAIVPLTSGDLHPQTPRNDDDRYLEIRRHLPQDVRLRGVGHPEWPLGVPDDRGNVIVFRCG